MFFRSIAEVCDKFWKCLSHPSDLGPRICPINEIYRESKEPARAEADPNEPLSCSRQTLKFNENLFGFVARKLLNRSDAIAKFAQGAQGVRADIDQD